MFLLPGSFGALSPTGAKVPIDPRRLLALAVALTAFNASGAQDAASFPAGFIENRGQVNEVVLYYAAGPGATIYFTRDALVFDLRGPMTGGEWAPPQSSSARRGCAVWARFEGAWVSPRVEARGELPGRHSFFLGSDPTRWRTDVPSYQELVYHDVRPGVDLVFRNRDGELAYATAGAYGGASPAFAFRFEGADDVTRHGATSVRVETPAGRLLESRTSNGQGSFLLEKPLTGGARSEARDDPSALLWSTLLGESSGALALARDPSGDVVLGGVTGSPSFPTTPGSYDPSFNGGECDVFVARLSSTGSTLLWST
ncbi:MAG: hypothetical protein QUU85_11720, partial [Candidatus Eisenbacteria bacterium]|nr:hypothetical protein [Candidatus Eisenbacteria bacterium]